MLAHCTEIHTAITWLHLFHCERSTVNIGFTGWEFLSIFLLKFTKVWLLVGHCECNKFHWFSMLLSEPGHVEIICILSMTAVHIRRFPLWNPQYFWLLCYIIGSCKVMSKIKLNFGENKKCCDSLPEALGRNISLMSSANILTLQSTESILMQILCFHKLGKHRKWHHNYINRYFSNVIYIQDFYTNLI